MTRKRDPKTGKLLIEGVHPIVSARTGAVTYRARYTYESAGKRRHASRTFADADAATAWLYARRLEVDRDRHVDVETITVADYYARWHARRSREWTPSSARTASSVWRNHLAPAIGDMRLQRVTRAHLQGVVDHMERAGLAPSTIGVYVAVASSLFRAAIVDGLIATNPASDLVRSRRAADDRGVWTPLQLRAFLASTRGAPDAALWAFLIATGCRIGEALALEWRDVDLPAGTVHVRRTMTTALSGRTVARAGTKTNARGRVIPLDPWIRDRLAALERRGALVFPNGTGTHQNPLSVRKRFRAASERAGLPPIRLHGLRHSVASAMIADGVNIKIVQEVLGHTSIQTTLDTYAHVDTATKRQGTGSIARMVGVARDNVDAETGITTASVSESVSESRRKR